MTVCCRFKNGCNAVTVTSGDPSGGNNELPDLCHSWNTQSRKRESDRCWTRLLVSQERSIPGTSTHDFRKVPKLWNS